MKNTKMLLVTITMTVSLNVFALEAALVGVSANNYTNDFETQPVSSGTSTISGATQYTHTAAVDFNSASNTPTSSSTPLLSTVPQFNVKDVKVAANGNCEIRKNGALIKSGAYSGSPCQKIYGKGIQSSGSGSTATEVLPDEYRDPDFSSLKSYQSSNYAY